MYITGLVTGAALFLTPCVLLRIGTNAGTPGRTRRAVRLGGRGVVTTYLLILFAFQMGSVSYVVAVRDCRSSW